MSNSPNETGTAMITHRTKDLNQAAFFWCQEGVEIIKLDSANNRGRGVTIFFVLSLPMTENEFQQLQLKFANNKTVVEPNKFVEKQSKLRDLIHNSIGVETRRAN